MKKEFHLAVAVTDKCNRGCKHCCVSVTNEGEKFVKAMWVRKIVREAKELGYEITGTVSGIGEPLMHPKIMKVTEAFTGLKVCRRICFVTSGFLEKDEEEKKRFQKIINSRFWRIMMYSLSFNLYAPTFPERLEQTLAVLIRNRKMSFIDIGLVSDSLNYFQTFKDLSGILSGMEIRLGVEIVPLKIDYSSKAYKDRKGFFLHERYDEEIGEFLYGNSLFIPYIYTIESRKYGKKYLRINPSMTFRQGNAENLPKRCIQDEKSYKCFSVMLKKDEVENLIMDPDGKIFPSCDCYDGRLQIGNWETPLAKLIARKRALQEDLLRHVLVDTSMKWGHFPCRECAKLARKNFAFIQS